MNRAILAIIGSIAVLMAACKTEKAPSFNPRDQDLTNQELAGHKALTNAADFEEQSFTSVTLTNQITLEMLKPSLDPFRVGPGDLLDIETMGEQGSRSSVVIGPDGRIYYGLLPGIFVWGKTLAETRGAIEEGLKKYLRVPPDVTVTLRGAVSKNVWVLGNVQAPGLYPLATPMSVLETLTAAGGALTTPGTRDGVCDLQRSFVMRDGSLLPVDLDRLLRLGDLSQNIQMQPNDFLYLRSGTTRSIYVIGAVVMPSVLPFQDHTTLVKAILSAGGPVPYAYLSQVAVIRGSLTEPRLAEVNYKDIIKGEAKDVILQPGDIVYVPYVPWRKIATFAEGMLNAFVQTMAVNGGYYLVYPDAYPQAPVVPTGQPQPVTLPPPSPTINR
jgi:protein involved in polysaccharide export with SLBB domain